MAKIDLIDQNKKKVSEITLKDDLFGVSVNKALISEVVRSQIAANRSGTANTKERSEVLFTGAKIYRQKGLGRARHGSKRAPIFVGGGTTFGPKPRSFGFKVNKKVKATALKGALSLKLSENHLHILDKIELKEVKTKNMVKILEDLGVKSTLFVTSGKEEALELASRNIPSCKCIKVDGLNVLDIIGYEDVIILQPALEAIEKRLEKK